MPEAPSPKKESSRRHFDRWAGRYEEDRASRWLASMQDEALEALDLGLRLFQPSHIHFYRSRELESLLAEAGLSSQGSRLLWRGGYVITAAGRGRKAAGMRQTGKDRSMPPRRYSDIEPPG